MVGDSISVTGQTHGLDEQSLLDAEVGYFTMIDAVASEGIEGERNGQGNSFMLHNREKLVSILMLSTSSSASCSLFILVLTLIDTLK